MCGLINCSNGFFTDPISHTISLIAPKINLIRNHISSHCFNYEDKQSVRVGGWEGGRGVIMTGSSRLSMLMFHSTYMDTTLPIGRFLPSYKEFLVLILYFPFKFEKAVTFLTSVDSNG